MNHYHLCDNHSGIPYLKYPFDIPLIVVSSHFGYPPNLSILAFRLPPNIPVFWCHLNLSVSRFGCFSELSIPIFLNLCAQVPCDVGENTYPTLVVLQPPKPALQLDFFIMFLLFHFVAMSLK